MQVTLQLDEPGTIWCRDAHLLICRGLGGRVGDAVPYRGQAMSLQGPDASICDTQQLAGLGPDGCRSRAKSGLARTSMTPSPATMKATSKVPDSPQHP